MSLYKPGSEPPAAMRRSLETAYTLTDFIVTPDQLNPYVNQRREPSDGKLKLNRNTITIQPWKSPAGAIQSQRHLHPEGIDILFRIW